MPFPAPDPLLSVDDLSVRFASNDAVRSLSLEIGAGESMGLVGESGSGKSVTSLAILRLLGSAATVSGQIEFGGRELLALPEDEMRRLRGRDIAMIFQEPMTALNPVMPVGDQIAEAIRAHHRNLPRRQLRERVLESMAAVALPNPSGRYNDYAHQFSGGQRQRILIAMAIANRPRLLIADEPTTALDVTVQAQILELLADLRERFALAMLFISHDLAVVSQVSDRVAVMRQGLIVETAARRTLFEAPLHPYTRSLLGAVPTMRTSLAQPLAMLGPSGSFNEFQSSAQVPLRETAPGHWARIP